MIDLPNFTELKGLNISNNKIFPVILKVGSAVFVTLEFRNLYEAIKSIYLDMKKKSSKLCLETDTKDISEVSKTVISDPVWNTALFFPDMFPESENSVTNKLIWYLNQAQLSIHLCMFSLSFGQLERALSNIKKKGVIIEAAVHNPATARRLFKKGMLIDIGIDMRMGINVKKWKQTVISPYHKGLLIDLMHHKFFIIDGKAVINGSLNWTREGVTRNTENVMITNNRRAVASFMSEFSKIWFDSEIVTEADLKKMSLCDAIIN